MAVERGVAGGLAGLTFASVFGAEINGLASGNAILSSVAVSNGAPLDLYADVSVSLGSLTSAAGNPIVGLYLYPFNQDGSTYGDGAFVSAAAGPPPSAYFAGIIPVRPGATGVVVGMVRGILLPPGRSEERRV